jgi:hypothetical protein
VPVQFRDLLFAKSRKSFADDNQFLSLAVGTAAVD